MRTGARARRPPPRSELYAGLLGQPLDRLGEPEPVHLHHELDDVAPRLTAEAVAGEDVVGENEGVAVLDLRAEDFLTRSVDSTDLTAHPRRAYFFAERRNRSEWSGMRKKSSVISSFTKCTRKSALGSLPGNPILICSVIP